MERIPVSLIDPVKGFIPVEMDDVILSMDPDSGMERMQFELNWDPKTPCYCRFPVHGMWNGYRADLSAICSKFTDTMRTISIPDLAKARVHRDIHDNEHAWVEHWAIVKSSFEGFYELSAEMLMRSDIAKPTEEAFFKYLRPEVDGVAATNMREWFNDTAPIGAPAFYMVSLSKLPELLKKKMSLALRPGFPQWTRPNSSVTPISNGVTVPVNSMEQASWS